MKRTKVIIAVMLVLILLCGTAIGETWKAEEENLPLFQTIFERLSTEETEKIKADPEELNSFLELIREKNPDDYEVGRAILDHWYGTARNSNYRRFAYRGEEKAVPLERSGYDFSGKHAFVVLGYQLVEGAMAAELAGRCDAAAAAARSFPDSVLICTGGVTGADNPDNHTEAEEMKKYLTNTCGIEAERILTDPEARTTLENAINTFLILKKEGIQKITLVTSDYHQMWAQILFNAVAAVWKVRTGFEVSIVGNYNWTERPEAARSVGSRGMGQLMMLLRDGIKVEP